jgi:hypothetical protein
MSSIVFQSKQAFIDALEARREFWQVYDKRALNKHELAKQQWLAKAKLELTQALELDYDQLKEKRSVYFGDTPRYPVSGEEALDRVLMILNLTQSSKFTISPDGGWKNAYQLLTQQKD